MIHYGTNPETDLIGADLVTPEGEILLEGRAIGISREEALESLVRDAEHHIELLEARVQALRAALKDTSELL